MTSNIPTLTTSEVVAKLYMELGPVRSWADFLSDNIRHRQSIKGLTLMPCARKRDARTLRPVYAVADVETFIKNVLNKVPSAGPAIIVPHVLSVDQGRNWKVNKFDRDGTAIMCNAIRHNKYSHTQHAH